MRNPLKKLTFIPTLLIAASALLANVIPANATAYWAPARFSCSTGKVAVLHLTVVNNPVIIGYGLSIWDAGNTPNYVVLNPGIRNINTGLNSGYWSKWADNGNGTISSSSVMCVNYLFTTANP